jgi:hypothetical protein
MLIYLTPLFFALFNRIRGGLIPGLKGASAYLAAALIGLWLWMVTQSPFIAITFAAAYVLGESFGWGKWVAVVPRPYKSQDEYNASKWPARDDGKNNGVHAAANALFKENEDYYRYALTALALRAALWWVGPLIALSFINPWSLATLPILAVTFPLTFVLAFKISAEDYWSLGEWLYGLILGLVIAGLLL